MFIVLWNTLYMQQANASSAEAPESSCTVRIQTPAPTVEVVKGRGPDFCSFT